MPYFLMDHCIVDTASAVPGECMQLDYSESDSTVGINNPMIFMQDNVVSFRNLNLTLCFTSDKKHFIFFSTILFGYFVVLTTTAVVLILLNKRTHTRFRDDILHSFRAVILSFFPLLFSYVSVWIFDIYELYWWMVTFSFLLLNIVAQLALFSPLVRPSLMYHATIHRVEPDSRHNRNKGKTFQAPNVQWNLPPDLAGHPL